MKISLILVGIIFLSLRVWANENFRTTPKSASNIQQAIGVGTSGLSIATLLDKEEVEYSTTNNNFYFLSIGYRGLTGSAKLPMPDPKSSQLTRGKTKSSDFQFAYGFKENWQAEVYFQKYKGYYIETETAAVANKNLSLAHDGGQLIYVFNPNYSLAMVRDAVWSQSNHAGSWTIGIGYDRFKLRGELLPTELGLNHIESINSADADSFTIRPSYGYNWVWTKWYIGVAGGIGSVWSKIKYQKSNLMQTSEDSRLVTNLGFSTGYGWNKNKIGLFARSYQWALKINDKKIYSSTALSGIYFNSQY